MHDLFTTRVVAIIKQIPPGTVSTYGLIARFAGNSRAARQVAWILHSLSEKEHLPWYRVINARGEIVVGNELDKEEQAALLRGEGVDVDASFCIDLRRFLWKRMDVEC